MLKYASRFSGQKLGRPTRQKFTSRLHSQRQNLKVWLKITSILRPEVALQSTRAILKLGFGSFWTFKFTSKCSIWFLGQITISSLNDFQIKTVKCQFKYDTNHLPLIPLDGHTSTMTLISVFYMLSLQSTK